MGGSRLRGLAQSRPTRGSARGCDLLAPPALGLGLGVLTPTPPYAHVPTRNPIRAPGPRQLYIIPGPRPCPALPSGWPRRAEAAAQRSAAVKRRSSGGQTAAAMRWSNRGQTGIKRQSNGCLAAGKPRSNPGQTHRSNGGQAAVKSHSNSDQALVIQRSRSGQAAVKWCLSSCQTAVKQRSSSGQAVVKQRSSSGQAAVKQRSSSGDASVKQRWWLPRPPFCIFFVIYNAKRIFMHCNYWFCTLRYQVYFMSDIHTDFVMVVGTLLDCTYMKSFILCILFATKCITFAYVF